MRNVAFSIMLGALAVLQIAVVAATLSPSPVQIASTGNGEFGARHTVAAIEMERDASAL